MQFMWSMTMHMMWGECEAVLVVTDLNGNELYKASKEIVLLQDSRLRVFEI